MWTSRTAVVVGMLLAPALAAAQPGPADSAATPPPAPPVVAAQPAQYAPTAPPPQQAAPPPPQYAPMPAAYSGPPGEYVAPARPMLQPGEQQIYAQPGSQKDPQVAGMLSGLITGGGLGLMLIASKMDSNNSDGSSNGAQSALGTVGALAFVVGPTTGHIYAGHTWNAGLGIRTASVVLFTIGLASLIGSCDDGCDDDNNGGNGAAVLVVGSMIGYAAGTIYEIATAPQAARDYNHSHGLDMQLSVVPIRDTRNGTSPGVGFVGRF